MQCEHESGAVRARHHNTMPDGATRERKHRLHHLLAVGVAAGLNHACHTYEDEMSHARASPVWPTNRGRKGAPIVGAGLGQLVRAPTSSPRNQREDVILRI